MDYIPPNNLSVDFDLSSAYTPPLPATFTFDFVIPPQRWRVDGIESFTPGELPEVKGDFVRFEVGDYSATLTDDPYVGYDQTADIIYDDSLSVDDKVAVVKLFTTFLGAAHEGGWGPVAPQTEYYGIAMDRAPKYLTPDDYLGTGFDVPFISYWLRRLYFIDGKDEFSYGPFVIGTEQFLEPDWSSSFLSDKPKVIRWLDVEPLSITAQLQTDLPTVTPTPWARPYETEQTEVSPDWMVSRWLQDTTPLHIDSLTTVDPFTPHNTWQFVIFDPLVYVEPETKTEYVDVKNKNKNIGPYSIESFAPGDWEDTIRNTCGVATPEPLDSFESGRQWVSLYVREVKPLDLAKNELTGKPYVYNAGKGIFPHHTDMLQAPYPTIILGERTLYTFWLDQSEYNRPIIGTERTITHREQYPLTHAKYGSLTVLPAVQEIKDIGDTPAPPLERPSVRQIIVQIEVPMLPEPTTRYEAYRIGNFDRELYMQSKQSLEYDLPDTYNYNRYIDVAPGFPSQITTPINTIVEKDEFIAFVDANPLSDHGWFRVQNELVIPGDDTQRIYVPRNELHDLEPIITKPETLYGDITFPSTGCMFEDGSNTFLFGDIRVDNNVVGVYDGRLYSSYGAIDVSHLHRSITITGLGHKDEFYDRPDVGPRPIVFENCGHPLTNSVHDGCALTFDGYDPSPPVISLFNRTLFVTGTDCTGPGPIGTWLPGEPQWCSVLSGSTPAPGPIVVYPYKQMTFTKGVTLTEYTEYIIETPYAEPVPTEQEIKQQECVAPAPGNTKIENQHREIYINETETVVYGDNYPMIHREREVMPDEYEATLFYTHWVSPDPQVQEIGDDELLDNDWDLFYGKMHVMQKPQHITPLGIDATKPGLVRMRRQL